jgi:hypothetical protein
VVLTVKDILYLMRREDNHIRNILKEWEVISRRLLKCAGTRLKLRAPARDASQDKLEQFFCKTENKTWRPSEIYEDETCHKFEAACHFEFDGVIA